MILISNLTHAQITTTKVAPEKTNEIKPIYYDSTRNFLAEDISQIIGQTLYLPPEPENLQKYGFDGFVIDYTDAGTINYNKNVYKCCDSYNSKYSELNSKYFEVLGVYNHPHRDKDRSLYGTTYFLKLKEKSSGDIVFYSYDSDYEFKFPFIVTGFFEKQKKASIGIEFILRGKNWRETIFNADKPLNDIVTGEEIIIEPGSIWKVVDLTLEDKYYTLSYIIQNDKGNKLTLDITSSNRTRVVFKKKDVQTIIDKSPEFWNKIVEGKVVIGMTEQMVKLSLAEGKVEE